MKCDWTIELILLVIANELKIGQNYTRDAIEMCSVSYSQPGHPFIWKIRIFIDFGKKSSNNSYVVALFACQLIVDEAFEVGPCTGKQSIMIVGLHECVHLCKERGNILVGSEVQFRK